MQGLALDPANLFVVRVQEVSVGDELSGPGVFLLPYGLSGMDDHLVLASHQIYQAFGLLFGRKSKDLRSVLILPPHDEAPLIGSRVNKICAKRIDRPIIDTMN